MRTILLWAARNQWLRTHIPRLPGAQRAVRRFMPGEDMDDALRAAGALQAKGIPSIFTHLGENLTDLAQADEVAAHYHELIHRFARWGLRPDVSPKLTQLGLDLDPEATIRHAVDLARRTTAAGGRFYAVGGRIDGSYARNLATNEAYDPAADRWDERAPMPTARSGIAAALLEGRIFIVGGEAPSGTFHQVEAYDAASNGWTSHLRMPTARHGLGAVAVAGRIYVISGGPRPGASSSAANEVFMP